MALRLPEVSAHAGEEPGRGPWAKLGVFQASVSGTNDPRQFLFPAR